MPNFMEYADKFHNIAKEGWEFQDLTSFLLNENNTTLFWNLCSTFLGSHPLNIIEHYEIISLLMP